MGRQKGVPQKDLSGMIFGDFKVVKYTGDYYWKCKCIKCGYETSKKAGTLKKWKNYCPECKSPIGKIFGDYIVVSRKETNNKYDYVYNCECINCGHSETRSYNNLHKSNNRCQICNKEFNHKEFKGYKEDLTGKKFGKLTVISFVGKKHSHSLWECICECGKNCEKTNQQLKRAKCPMCDECYRPVKIEIAKQQRSENKVDKYDDYAIINNKIIVDLEDVDRLLSFNKKLLINSDNHVYINDENHEQIFIHRYLVGLPNRYDPVTQLISDHQDGNPLNNRKENLRIIPKPLNSINCKTYKNNTSGCKGVTLHKRTGKWQANIQYQKTNHYLGLFENYDDAVKARKEAEKKYFGDLNRSEESA